MYGDALIHENSRFQTCYLHPSGRKRLRVTTVQGTQSNGFGSEAAEEYVEVPSVHRCADERHPARRVLASCSGFVKLLGAGFDQEAAAVLMARYAVFKCENEAGQSEAQMPKPELLSAMRVCRVALSKLWLLRSADKSCHKDPLDVLRWVDRMLIRPMAASRY